MSSSRGSKAPASSSVASDLKRKYEDAFDQTMSAKIIADASSKLQGDQLTEFKKLLSDSIVCIRTAQADGPQAQEAYHKFRQLQVEAEFMVVAPVPPPAAQVGVPQGNPPQPPAVAGVVREGAQQEAIVGAPMPQADGQAPAKKVVVAADAGKEPEIPASDWQRVAQQKDYANFCEILTKCLYGDKGLAEILAKLLFDSSARVTRCRNLAGDDLAQYKRLLDEWDQQMTSLAEMVEAVSNTGHLLWMLYANSVMRGDVLQKLKATNSSAEEKAADIQAKFAAAAAAEKSRLDKLASSAGAKKVSESAAPPKKAANNSEKPRSKCSFCGSFGHDADKCQNRNRGGFNSGRNRGYAYGGGYANGGGGGRSGFSYDHQHPSWQGNYQRNW